MFSKSVGSDPGVSSSKEAERREREAQWAKQQAQAQKEAEEQIRAERARTQSQRDADFAAMLEHDKQTALRWEQIKRENQPEVFSWLEDNEKTHNSQSLEASKNNDGKKD
ncbi:hypothetical protein [Martelella sp. HB161492]|uniref:hypothetical protein n=1 Tax=Martelella sp. HB161492 TaxID=2720726 RepID=UPI0015919A60|nr:hypothetical protein [Martelella sp. HB161492]